MAVSAFLGNTLACRKGVFTGAHGITGVLQTFFHDVRYKSSFTSPLLVLLGDKIVRGGYRKPLIFF